MRLDERIVIEKQVHVTLESLSDLHLGTHLAELSPGRLQEWRAELGGPELTMLETAAHECRFVAHLGSRIELRLEALAVRGRIRNINDPADVRRAVRARILERESELAPLVGSSVAANALSDADEILKDVGIQEFVPRYSINSPRAATLAAEWQSKHYQATFELLDQRPADG